jgi:hypothetical protein
MKPSATHSVEPLEARIAPARVIIVGAANGGGAGPFDVDYLDENATNDAIFINTEDFYLTDGKIAGKVGPGLIGAADTHYVRMSAGDLIELRTSGGAVDLLKVTTGNIIAFFVDKNLDNEIQEDELTGISLGKNAKVVVNGTVHGDVVANLNELGAGLADDELAMNDLISDKQTIGSISANSVKGSIIAGGNISNVAIVTSVDAILAGTAANGKTIDFFPGVAGGDGTLSVTIAPGKAGPSITNVSMNQLGSPALDNPDPLFTGRIQAGDGGFGAKGGSVTFVQVRQDSTGMRILAGDGGGSGGGKVNGGAGGAVSRIFIGGAPDSTVDLIEIGGGDGGDSATGKGGVGGTVKDVFVGYSLFGNKPFPTSNLLEDRILITGGEGGEGKVGGLGGAISNVDVRVDTTEDVGDEIAIKGGAGGAVSATVLSGGKAGAGGNLTNIVVRNQDLAGSALYADTLIQGGAGGAGGTGNSGGAGGNVSGVTLLGWQIKVLAGNGSDGKVGGHGGSLTNIFIEENDAILPIGAQFDAGSGGIGTAGNGGNGGNIKNILFEDSDLQDFAINGGVGAGNGGSSTGGKGGAGGSVQSVEVRDNDVSNGATQTTLQPLSVRTGSGGDGTKGGGAGGLLKLFSLDSTNVNAQITTGVGGNVTAGGKGKGGAGGSLDNVSIIVRDVVGTTPAFATVVAGAGGNGAGIGGAGGFGGDLKTVTLTADGAGFLHAGNGGSGSATAGAAGRGGNIVVSQLKTLGGDGELIAGNAGIDGAKPGAGGSILGQNAEVRSSLFARNNLLVQAGNGSHGGAGGHIRFLGYGSSVGGVTASPIGNIVIQAGRGGDGVGNLAGVGGSIQDVSGSLPSADPLQPGVSFTASITAGAGGAGTTKSGAGGSVQDILVLGGGFDGAILTVQAGDAGVSSGASVGAKGGDVKNVDVSPDKNFGMGSIFRSVAAGDGSIGLKKGGAGGNIQNIFVDGIDIGDRNDVPYGFTSMGGIFAGKAGENGNAPNGKVVTVVAKGIAAIVAGRGATPAPAEFVDDIALSGSNSLLRENNVFIQPGPFYLAFHANAAVAETTPGAIGVPEVQFVELVGLQLPSIELVVGYGADSITIPLPGNATAAQIEAALNSLDSIKATQAGNTGSVTVTASGTGFSVTFNTEGNKDAISIVATAKTGLFPEDATEDDVQLALNALPTIRYLSTDHVSGSVEVEGQNGSFRITFEQAGNVLAIEGIEAFNANLTELIQGVSADAVAAETTSGTINLGVAEVQTGQQALVVTEVAAGDVGVVEVQGLSVNSIVNVPGAKMQLSFTGSFVTAEDAGGDVGTREVQSFNMTAIKADLTSTFRLTFNGGTTAALPSTATPAQIAAALNLLPQVQQIGQVAVQASVANPNIMQITFNLNGARAAITGTVTSTSIVMDATVTDAQIETELNKMAAVKITSPDQLVGGVTVETIDGANAFLINFTQAGDQQPIQATGFANEVQRIDHAELELDPSGEFSLSFSRDYQGVQQQAGGLGTRERQEIRLGNVLGSATSTFTISFNGRTTRPLFGNVTPAQIETAIEFDLGVPIKGITPPPPGVTIAAGLLTLTFDTFGDNPLLFSATATATTGLLPATATAADVQAALNALPTITGPNNNESVVVTNQAITNDFEVTFSALGQRNPIVAGLTRQEVQSVDVSALLTEGTSSFRLGYVGAFTADLLPSATATDVQNALNSLQSIIDAGLVTVTAGAQPGLFDVTFNTKGERFPLDIHQEIDEVQDIDFAQGPPVTFTVDHDVTASVLAPGGTGVQEVQILSLGAIRTSGEAQFTISYDPGAGVRTTIALPGNATALQIQNEINALFDPGFPGVLVEDVGNNLQITFNIEGAQTDTFELHATQSTPELPATATAQDIQNELNDLLTVQAKGTTGTDGSVVVTLGENSNVNVRFNTGGDQLPIQASQERALQSATIRPGNTVVAEIQAFSPQAKGQPTEAAYAIANLIGFYADHTEIDANVFHFIKNGVPTDASVQPFAVGDQPIDGLLFAKKVNQARISVTPEASWIGTRVPPFYDWNNRI